MASVVRVIYMKTVNLLLIAVTVLLLAACAQQQRRVAAVAEWRVGDARDGVRIERKRTDAGLRYRAYNTNSFDVCVKVAVVNISGQASFTGYDNYRLVKARGYRGFGQVRIQDDGATWDMKYWIRRAVRGSC